ncbi:MAG: sigma-70 family RNA polymerase sigma factor [Microbacterium sp.]
MTSRAVMPDVDMAGKEADAPPARWERAAALFTQWRDGDSRAIDELVRLMTPTLWHIVRSYGLRAEIAEDVLQVTWLALVRKHESIASPQAVSSWLTTTARREAWRSSKIDNRSISHEVEQLELELPTASSAEDDATARVEQKRLWDAVMTLDGRCQQLLRIIAFEDKPDYARIATDLKMPVGSIGPTRQRCLKKLREKL